MKKVLPLLLLLLPVTGVAATGLAAEPVSLDRFLNRVAQHHPFLAKEARTPEIERERRRGLTGAEDWRLSARPAYQYRQGTGNSLFAPDRSDLFSLNLAAERDVWSTGGRLSVAYDYTHTDQPIGDLLIPLSGGATINIPAGPERFSESRITVGYTLPLKRNRGGTLSKLAYRLAEADVATARLVAAENIEGFLADTGSRYLEWVHLTEQHRIARRRLLLAEAELERAERKRAQHLIDPVDVLRARAALLASRQDLLDTTARERAARAELAVLADLPEAQLTTPDFDLYRRVTLPPLDQAISRLRQRARLLRMFDHRRRQLARQQNGAIDQVQPSLDLQLNGTLAGGGEQLANGLALNDPGYGIGVLYRHPLGNRAARSEVTRIRLEQDRLEQSRAATERDLIARLSALSVQLAELEKVLTVNREAVEIARQKTAEELRLHGQGRTELTFVIQSRDDEQQAQLRYAANAARYHTLLLRYRELTDTLRPEPSTPPAGRGQ